MLDCTFNQLNKTVQNRFHMSVIKIVSTLSISVSLCVYGN